jgi:hypothetical protein
MEPLEVDRLVYGGSLYPPYPPPEVTPARHRRAILVLLALGCLALWGLVVLLATR